MSFQAMAWAVNFDLPVKQKMVLLMLANRTNADTGRCDPSMDKLAADCGMSKTSVKSAIRELKELGIVAVEERRIGDVHLTNQYTLNLSILGGVGREATGGRACDAPGVGRVTPPKLESKPVNEPDIENAARSDQFSLLSEDTESAKPDRFEEFWEAYPKCPRKTDKPKARAAFRSITEGKHKAIAKTDPATIIAAVKAYAATRPDPAYIPLPLTWLNGERWAQFEGVKSGSAVPQGVDWARFIQSKLDDRGQG
jgi:biotin operon repressor